METVAMCGNAAKVQSKYGTVNRIQGGWVWHTAATAQHVQLSQLLLLCSNDLQGTTSKYWVQPDKVVLLKTRIVEHLPHPGFCAILRHPVLCLSLRACNERLGSQVFDFWSLTVGSLFDSLT